MPFFILFTIFSLLVFIAGVYIYTGHNSELLLWKGYNPKATKKDLKLTGTWIIISSIIIFLIGLLGFFIEI